MKTFSIARMKNVNWENSPNIRAVVDINVLNAAGKPAIVMKDCKLISGEWGTFVASASRKCSEPYVNKSTGKTVEYVDVNFIHKGSRDELNELVANAYDDMRAPGTLYTEFETTYSNGAANNMSSNDDILAGLPT